MRQLAIACAAVLALASYVACGGDEDPPGASAPELDAGAVAPADAGATIRDPADGGGDAGFVGPNPAYSGEPIVAEPGKWTWVSFPDSSCMNGSPAGLGVSIGTSKTLLVYLEGGGACWDEKSCFISPSTARPTSGVTEKDIAALSSSKANWPFNRANAENPFKDASMVYVPYCTGDVYSGAREMTYGKKSAKHFGRKNIEAFLQRIVPTFSKVERVVFSGSSAGGFGAFLNFDRVQNAFGTIRVDLVDDAGQPLPADSVKLYSTWDASWDLAGNVPAGCPDCAQGFDRLLPYYIAKYPRSRLALLTFATDNVISGYFQITEKAFNTALLALTTSTFDPSANARYFMLGGKGHGTLDNLGRTSGGTTLGEWLGDMQSDAPAWASVKPQ